MSDYEDKKLSQIIDYTTGKLNSIAAVECGQYPFFTCARETYRTDTWAFDCECVLLAGNNANAEFPIKYFSGGKFDAYQRTYVMTPKDEEELDIRYLYYVLELKLNLLKTLSTGATTKFLTKTILDDLKIDLPDIETQKKIVPNLAPLEDLIETNSRRIEILEEMARRIYREWFVHFRYPGHENDELVDSGTELGAIPEGWEVKELGELYKVKSGFAFKSKNLSDEGPFGIIKIKNVNDNEVDIDVV
jgi:type I restriction enzyme S subunit